MTVWHINDANPQPAMADLVGFLSDDEALLVLKTRRRSLAWQITRIDRAIALLEKI